MLVLLLLYQIGIRNIANLSDIRKELIEQTVGAADTTRRKYLRELSEFTQRDTLLYVTTFMPKQGIPEIHLQISQPDIGGFMSTLYALNPEKTS